MGRKVANIHSGGFLGIVMYFFFVQSVECPFYNQFLQILHATISTENVVSFNMSWKKKNVRWNSSRSRSAVITKPRLVYRFLTPSFFKFTGSRSLCGSFHRKWRMVGTRNLLNVNSSSLLKVLFLCAIDYCKKWLSLRILGVGIVDWFICCKYITECGVCLCIHNGNIHEYWVDCTYSHLCLLIHL